MTHELITHTTAAARELLAALEAAIEGASEFAERAERAEAKLAKAEADLEAHRASMMQPPVENVEVARLRSQLHDAQTGYAELLKELEYLRTENAYVREEMKRAAQADEFSRLANQAQAEATALRAQLAEAQARAVAADWEAYEQGFRDGFFHAAPDGIIEEKVIQGQFRDWKLSLGVVLVPPLPAAASGEEVPQ